MSTYARLQKLAGEKIFEVASLKLRAAYLIKDAINVCVQTYKFPSEGFACQDAREEPDPEIAVDCRKLVETVSYQADRALGCRLFVTIEYTGNEYSGSVRTKLEPRISFGSGTAKLGFEGHKGTIILKEKSDRSRVVREYAAKLMDLVEQAIKEFSAIERDDTGKMGFHATMVTSADNQQLSP